MGDQCSKQEAPRDDKNERTNVVCSSDTRPVDTYEEKGDPGQLVPELGHQTSQRTQLLPAET